MKEHLHSWHCVTMDFKGELSEEINDPQNLIPKGQIDGPSLPPHLSLPEIHASMTPCMDNTHK